MPVTRGAAKIKSYPFQCLQTTVNGILFYKWLYLSTFQNVRILPLSGGG